MNRLRKFTLLWLRHNKNASAAAQAMRPDYPYRKAALWATASRLLRRARQDKDFLKWVAEAENVSALNSTPNDGTSEVQLEYSNPLRQAKTEEAAAREFARQARPSEQNPNRPRWNPPRVTSNGPPPEETDSHLPPWARWARGDDGPGPVNIEAVNQVLKGRRAAVDLLRSYSRPALPLENGMRPRKGPVPRMPDSW